MICSVQSLQSKICPSMAWMSLLSERHSLHNRECWYLHGPWMLLNPQTSPEKWFSHSSTTLPLSFDTAINNRCGNMLKNPGENSVVGFVLMGGWFSFWLKQGGLSFSAFQWVFSWQQGSQCLLNIYSEWDSMLRIMHLLTYLNFRRVSGKSLLSIHVKCWFNKVQILRCLSLQSF